MTLFFSGIIYIGIGFYLAYSILNIDHSCGVHEGSLPNTWNTKVDHKNLIQVRSNLRKSFDATKFHLHDWENVSFSSRNPEITISGWLFKYYANKPIVIVVHGIFPNGKCHSEPNLVASLLIKNGINALTVDLRNYGESTLVSNYENLGLSEYLDVLGAFDYLQKRGFRPDQIGLMGISLGASTVIFAAAYEPKIKAIWADSSLAEFNMILTDEIRYYGFPNFFGPSVSMAGKLLSGIDPNDLNPAYNLSDHQKYFFTHGEDDQRILINHFNFIKEYANTNNINAEYWMVPNAGHVDSMFMYPKEYGIRMKIFFGKHLRN